MDKKTPIPKEFRRVDWDTEFPPNPWYKEVYYFFWRLWGYHLSPRSLYHHIKYLFQYITRGYSDKQCWSLDWTFAKFAIPRLKTLKTMTHGHPIDFKSIEEWHKAIDKMIWSFEFVLTDYGSEDFDFEDYKGWKKMNDARIEKYKEGMNLFTEYYWNLWD